MDVVSNCYWALSSAFCRSTTYPQIHSFEAMPKTNESFDSLAAKIVRVPPRRGQIKAKIMTNLVRMVEEVGRKMCSKEKVADESHPSKPHDSNPA
ncbi:hypothetical protein VNO78_22150 [Psophocarpus tetragonolobus]|uniref:Uncharacterized protein n=1 Tax=Psophocarpus tetragonolobus TaxID=3891 RepID=A0AAN9XI68_PSOTE